VRVLTGADGWTLRTHDGALAAHYEDTIVVYKSGPLVLTAA
jgi:methionyl aminopeptidase